MDREIFLKIREFVKSKNNHNTREVYLAYAFVRDVPYVKLEKKINEDKFGTVGRNSFLIGLAYRIERNIIKITDTNLEIRADILNWLMEKYSEVERVAA